MKHIVDGKKVTGIDKPDCVIYETINLDEVEKTDESTVLLRALMHQKYIKDGKEMGNNIAIALDHFDTEMQGICAVKMCIQFGKNLLHWDVVALQDFCEAFGWWWVITRTDKTTILVEFRKQ